MRWAGRDRRWRLLALLGALLLAGCSVLSVAYDNADRLALAYVDDWFDLDRAQGHRFRERFKARMAEHRREELPRYVAFLRQAKRLLVAAPTPAELGALFDASRELVEHGIRRTLPLMADTLVELTPAQVEHLAGEIAEANADAAEERLEDTPDERRREREKDLIHELEGWTGKLDGAQRDRLRGLVARIPDGAQAWADYRQTRQRGLLALLRARADRAALIAFAEDWWLGERHLEPALAEQLARNRDATAEVLAGLIASLTPKQRARATARIDELIEELEALHGAGV